MWTLRGKRGLLATPGWSSATNVSVDPWDLFVPSKCSSVSQRIIGHCEAFQHCAELTDVFFLLFSRIVECSVEITGTRTTEAPLLTSQETDPAEIIIMKVATRATPG